MQTHIGYRFPKRYLSTSAFACCRKSVESEQTLPPDLLEECTLKSSFSTKLANPNGGALGKLEEAMGGRILVCRLHIAAVGPPQLC